MLDATKLASKVGTYVAYGIMGLGAVVAVLFAAIVPGIWLFIIGNFLRSSSAASYEQLFVEKVLTGIPASAVASQEFVPVSPEVTLSQLVEDHVLTGPGRCYPVMAGDELLGLVTLTDLRHVPREEWADDNRLPSDDAGVEAAHRLAERRPARRPPAARVGRREPGADAGRPHPPRPDLPR